MNKSAKVWLWVLSVPFVHLFYSRFFLLHYQSEIAVMGHRLGKAL